jgi:hypothetical protein
MIGTLVLADRTFELRRFTLRENARAYPLACQLVAGGVIDRWLEAMERALAAVASAGRGEPASTASSAWMVSEEEMGQMADLVFMACRAADAELTREAFDELAISPRELIGAFFEARYCTGVWIRPEADEPAGEGDGEPAPFSPTSTSAE